MQMFGKIPKISESDRRKRFYAFGPFRVDVAKRLLLRQREPVTLTPKAFEILLALVERRGEVVLSEDLMRSVWPHTVVEEGNLNRNVSTLRKVLGEAPSDHSYVVTVPRRGYRFVADVIESWEEDASVNRSPALAGVGGVVNDRPAPANDARADSVAVLPFQNLSGDKQQEYFVDGLMEALLTDLAQVRALRVVSRTSAMRYKGTRKSLPEIARELSVDRVVEGSVIRSGDRVRITVQLIDAKTDHHVWANAYEGGLKDVLGLQSALARAVVREIRVALTPREQARLATVQLVSPAAHEAYLKGRYVWNQRTAESLDRSIMYFEQAIAIDPRYALAHAALADAYAVIAADGFRAPGEAARKAARCVQTALECDDRIGEAHATLAHLKFFIDWDFAGAEQAFHRALERSPNYATAQHWYALLLMYLRRFDEALQAFRKACDLDPLSPVIRAAQGLCYVFADRYDDALRQARLLIEMEPASGLAHDILGLAYQRLGRAADAAAELRRYVELSGRDSDSLMRLGCACAATGDTAAANAILEELEARSARQYVTPYDIAALLVALGNHERALARLAVGLEQRDPSLLMLAVDPAVDPLRPDSRFRSLLQRIGLPVDAA